MIAHAHVRLLLRLVPILLCGGMDAGAVELHIAPTGNDAQAGTRVAPFRTLAAARDAARRFAGREPVTIQVADGIYHLSDTLVLTVADSGTAQAPVVWRAEHEGAAVISGGQQLDLRWQPGQGGVSTAATPPGLAIDQVFVDGRRQRMARYPDFDATKPTAAYQGFAADAFSKERAARWADPTGGYIHAMHSARWGGYHYRITGKQPDGTITYEGGWQNNRQMGMHRDQRMVENIREELDAPGEWFHDAKANVLLLMPEPGTDLAKARIEVVRLRHLVECQGTAQAPVRHVTFQGFTFRHAARTFMDNKEPLLRSDWTIYRGGVVTLTGTEDVRILDCDFDQPGGNAVFVNKYNRRALIRGCHIHDTGASGVCFVGDPQAVRNPLFEYGQRQPLDAIDRTPGPRTDNYPADCAVEDCLIHGIGRVERQPAGVQISMAMGIAVRDTSIYDCARSGININEGTWGGHVIERCDVFDTVLETHDHGSFNSWGRDRYWTSAHRQVSQPAVQKDPALPYLDVVKPIIIRDSRWRCDHGWDIDLDDGSSRYEISNNLLLRGGLKFREGYGRKAWNNVLVNSGFHPHVWFDDSDSSFTGNIVMAAHAPIGQPAGWAKLVDRNCFASEQDRTRFLKDGADAHSVAGDPLFIDAATGDFRVKDGSPALKIGFTNFPMDAFGVKKPALKAIARTPVIPELKTRASAPGGKAPSAATLPSYWLGAPLHDLEGEEFSAFGTRKEDGGVQLVAVPAGSAAQRAGFQANDLVQQIDGRKIITVADLLAAIITQGDAPLTVTMVSNQKPETVRVTDGPVVVMEGFDTADGFARLKPPVAATGTVQAGGATNNDPLATLTDGKLGRGYGPVYGNGVADGAYRLDMGTVRPVAAVTAWSFNQGGNRGNQRWTAFGSGSADDPGWDLTDAKRFTPIGSVDTVGQPAATFRAVSLRARPGQTLGTFRWIVWRLSPVTPAGENSAMQELAVE